MTAFHGWSDARFAEILKTHPFLGRIERRDGFHGSHYVIGVEGVDKRFVLTRSHGYATARWLAEGGSAQRAIDAAAHEAIDQLMWSSIAGNGGDGELMGLHRWMTPKPGGLFWCVDRDADPEHLLPQVVECRDGDVERALKRMYRDRMRCGEYSTNARILLVAPGRETGSICVDDVQGYTVSVEPCPGMPEECGYLIDRHTWCLVTLGHAPHWMDLDGIHVVRSHKPGWLEARCVWYGQLFCNAPWRNARVVFADHVHRWRVRNDDAVECRCGEHVSGMRMRADPDVLKRLGGTIE